MSLFSSLFGGDSGFDAAARAKQLGLATGFQQASDLYQQGRDTVTDYTGRALGDINPLLNGPTVSAYGPAGGTTTGGATGGYNLYADATGANGPEGQARAAAAFTTDPGYNFTKGEALQATERATGTGGFQGSGNVLTALQDRASGLASQQYGNWVSRLAPYLQVAPGLATSEAGINVGAGNTLGSSLSNQGTLAYNTQAGIGDAQAAADVAKQNSENSLVKGLANAGVKLLGYAGPNPFS